MQFDKWTLFKNKWLNFWANTTTIIRSKQFAFGMVLFLVIIGFVMGFVFKYEIIKTELTFKHYLKASQEESKKQNTIIKVKYIMKLYHCDSLVIYESIMKTFNPILIATLIAIESEYQVNAISPAGALGLTQCMPDKFRKTDHWNDPETNIKVGANYLQGLLKQFKGDEQLALAAYNAGPGSVIKYNYQIPVTKNNETQNYIIAANKITKLISNLR
jgi:hypothetical protein